MRLSTDSVKLLKNWVIKCINGVCQWRRILPRENTRGYADTLHIEEVGWNYKLCSQMLTISMILFKLKTSYCISITNYATLSMFYCTQ